MITWFAGHPTASNLLLVLLLAIGAFSAPTLTRETFPEYRVPEVSITIEYRGAAAADVEEAICQRLGDVLIGVDFMTEFSCTARDSMASATATMSPDGDMGRFLDDIRTEIEAISDLPAQAEDPVIRELHRSDLVVAVAVSGEMAFTHLETLGDDLKDRLLALPGVADVVTQGLSQRQWQIEVSLDLLRQYGLGVEDIAQAVRRQNVDMPVGTLETPEVDVQLRFTSQSRRLNELGDLVVIAAPAGGELRIRDIATLLEAHERDEQQVWFNGDRALILEVYKSRRDDALDVISSVRRLVEEERSRLGPSVRLDLTQDMTSIVRDRLRMLVENGVFGLALVGLVLSAFFRPRLAWWALFGLPVAFAGGFAFMAIAGASLNMITLVALLMAIGIVMDDSVVITDNIARHAADGAQPLEAAIRGSREVLPGVMSSFLTTGAVFLPLSFLSGELGSVLEVLPIVLVAALLASLVEAFWVLPHHLKAGLQQAPASRSSPIRRAVDRGFERIRDGVGRLADGGIRYRYGVLAGVLLFLLVSGGYMAGGHVQMEAMPEIDGDVLEARVLLPQGTPLSRTRQVTDRVVAAMESLNAELSPRQPAGAELVKAVQVRFDYNPSAGESGAHVATVVVDLLSAEARSIDLDSLSRMWREAIGEVPGLISLVIQEPGFGPAGIPIELRLAGRDLETLRTAAEHLAARLSTYTGVSNIIHDLRPGKPQRSLELAAGASPLGITAGSVAEQLRSGLLGDVVDTVQVGDQHIEILVRQPAGERSSLDFLKDQVVMDADGNGIPLAEVVEARETRGWGQITRIDGRRTVTVTADVDSAVTNAEAILSDLHDQWFGPFLEQYPGVQLEVEGQAARSRETGQSIARGLLIGLLGIFLILSFQFRSYIEPLIVMVSIPVALMGAVWGHELMGYDLSMPSLIGAASLAGIVVNNAILLIQFIKQFSESGEAVARAAGRASRERTRAIFITSSTTIAGLLPLLFETSTQAMAIIPLVISVVFGLLVATVLVLVVLPALYVILDDLGKAKAPAP